MTLKITGIGHAKEIVTEQFKGVLDVITRVYEELELGNVQAAYEAMNYTLVDEAGGNLETLASNYPK